MRLSLGTIAEVIGGTLTGGDPTVVIENLSIDSRKLGKGDLFWAIRGRNFRGEDFLAQAVEAGAAAAVVHRDTPGITVGLPTIAVDDTEYALGTLARFWRRTVGTKVIALSGSAGKTTTKEMTAHILSAHFPTLATPGNLNNTIGLPLTIFKLTAEHQVAVLELGMNHPGELTRLTQISDPDIVVVTNIGNAHIGNFGSAERLAEAESEVLTAMREDGVAVLNADCPRTAALPSRLDLQARVVTFGTAPMADFSARQIGRIEPLGTCFRVEASSEAADVRLGLFGRFQVGNALAAMAACAQVGVRISTSAGLLASFAPPQMRAQVEYIDGVQVIADCYNASPDPMKASIASFGDVAVTGRRIALIGDMLELGDFSRAFHVEVGEAAAASGVDVLLAIGAATPEAVAAARARGLTAEHLPSAEAAAEALDGMLGDGDALLVKGSRGNKLERVLEMFRARRAAARNGERVEETSETR